ncbi:MAG: cyclodeaminase/cyclohydrolase family protein [Deltaproteobacteria bacterium]|nr:cyclodeaminase/cyclohydrolase family protein [Deltaproteobacteria bacterium]
MGKNIIDLNITNFLNEVASVSPVPGGGSVAALGGALAASLVSMVCRLTIGKKGYEAVEEEMKRILRKSENFRKKLTLLVVEDAQSYRQVIKSYKSSNKESVEVSLKQATRVPLKTAVCSNDVSKLAHKVYQKGNRLALSDAKVASFLAKSSVKGALENVKINLPLIADNKFKKRTEEKIRSLNCSDYYLIWERQEKPGKGEKM